MLYALLKPITAVLMRLVFRAEGRGREHVPAHGPLLVVANHSSLLDPLLVAGVAPRPLSFLAKAELFRVPLFGGLLRRLNARPIRREGADAGALRTALRVLEEGRALLVFPEGSRGAEGVLREPKAGAGMLAVLTGAPVVPVYVGGSGRAWPRGRWLPRPAKVVVTFGPPLRFGPGTGGGAPGSRREQFDSASREMMAAIARQRDQPTGVDAGDRSGRAGFERLAGRAEPSPARPQIH